MRRQLEEALVNAAILAGLSFCTTLAGIGASGMKTDISGSLIAALISAGLAFFARLAVERGLR